MKTMKKINLATLILSCLSSVFSLIWLFFLNFRMLATTPFISFLLNALGIVIIFCSVIIIFLAVVDFMKNYKWTIIVILVLILLIIISKIGMGIILSNLFWPFNWLSFLVPSILVYATIIILFIIKSHKKSNKQNFLKKGDSNNNETNEN
ncbi:MAG: hypothetical protein FWC11_00615 [Firmicutes bacterium]|nr:hypothetical protein [Bacillota bacterium]